MTQNDIIYDRHAHCDGTVVRILGPGPNDTSFAGTVISDHPGGYEIGHYAKDWLLPKFELVPTPHPDQDFIDKAICAAMQGLISREVNFPPLAKDIVSMVDEAISARQHFTKTNSNDTGTERGI